MSREVAPPDEGGTRGARILVVDDDRAVRTALDVNLRRAGYHVTLATSGEEALDLLHAQPYDAILTDVRMGGMSGVDLLGQVRVHWPDTRVLLMTGVASVEDAVAAMKGGAADYLIKPISREALLVLLARALDTRAMQRELAQLRRDVDERYGFEDLVGISPVMRAVYERVGAVADSTARVLIQGETGTGKELIARALHYRSRRARAPLVAVNCGAFPENLLESELFGHERGAFTGAVRTHAGKFEQADGGTLFLDEIGEIPPSVQVRLLRVLEAGEVTRVGGASPVHVDVRVVAATNRDLAAEVRAGRFRADLYYRLDVVGIRLPPLRERQEDVPLLVDHFARRHAARHGRATPRFGPEALRSLQAHDWPGNVRELEHLVERTVLFAGGGEVAAIEVSVESGSGTPPRLAAPATSSGERGEDAFAEGDAPGAAPRDADHGTTVSHPLHAGAATLDLDAIAAIGLPAASEAWERRVIVAALEEAGGVQARAARRLGLSRSNLNQRIQRLGIVLCAVRYA